MENSSLNEGKVKALERAMKQIERDFGAGAVMRLGDVGSNMNLEVISSGSLALDLALGIGGFPRGRVIEIYGPESSGKTTVALHAIAQAQKQGGIAAFIDAEHALDPIYARHLGRFAGSSDEPGAAQIDRYHQQIQDNRHFHQPVA